jgi:hypothetical protein
MTGQRIKTGSDIYPGSLQLYPMHLLGYAVGCCAAGVVTAPHRVS